LGSGFKIAELALILGLFFHSTGYVLILTKKWLGFILGDFFANLSGHPGMDKSRKVQTSQP
jgi:hypothetical protein